MALQHFICLLMLCTGPICLPQLYTCNIHHVCSRPIALEPKQHLSLQSPQHLKYLGSRILLYGNTSCTFQLELIVSGDISPNPGPVPKLNTDVTSSTLKKQSLISYDREYLLSLNPVSLNYTPTRPINHKVWSRVKDFTFRIGTKPRGKRGGRRKNLHKWRNIQVCSASSDDNCIPTLISTGQPRLGEPTWNSEAQTSSELNVSQEQAPLILMCPTKSSEQRCASLISALECPFSE